MKGNEKASGSDPHATEFARQLRSAPVRLSLSGLPLFKVDGDVPDNLSALLAQLREVEDEPDFDDGTETGTGKASGRSNCAERERDGHRR